MGSFRPGLSVLKESSLQIDSYGAKVGTFNDYRACHPRVDTTTTILVP